MNVLLIDGYVDEPSCLGVPPFLAPYPRYVFGVFKQFSFISKICYITIDQFRYRFKQQDFNLDEYELVIFFSGVSVPGKYLGGFPIRFSELKRYSTEFKNAKKILCGPATRFGIGEEGGKPSIPVDLLNEYFDYIITGDSECVLPIILPFIYNNQLISKEDLEIKRSNEDDITEIACKGSEIILQHPNFNSLSGGNLICEIETFRGCPRYKNSGCSFCIEPKKGPTIHRSISSITQEVKTLYQHGIRHFRLGNQTDFYAYRHKDYDTPRYPRPNPDAIKELLKNIRNACPLIKTLHIDNVNAINFALYPHEAEEITKSIVEYCTAGNIAAIGVESIDPKVIELNNLKVNQDELFQAIQIINKYGDQIGENGNPKFLPGLNFIMGLPGESKISLEMNYCFLKNLLLKNLLIRRINLRKLLIPSFYSENPVEKKPFLKKLQKNEKYYYQWKQKIRKDIDFPMLMRVYPFGRILKNVYAEMNETNGTFLRQPGTYPILCYVPKILTLYNEYSLIVVDHGFRSVSCLEYPLEIKKLTIKELESIPGIGKKRALHIHDNYPNSKEEWNEIVSPEIFEKLRKLQPKLL